MSNRTEVKFARTLAQLIEQGLYPCNGCISEALRCNGEPLFGRRVYCGGVADAYPMVSGACTNCGFVVWSNGAVRASFDIVREMRRREAKKNRGRPDDAADASPQVSKGGGLLMRHSDTKTKFSTGAHRDTDKGKGTPSLISPVLIHRLGVLLQKGAEHYGADNWMKGMPYRRTADSMIRHLFQWLAGDKKEDHLAAVCFGAMCLMTYESNRILDQKLDDRDEGLKKILASILTSTPKDATLKVDSAHKDLIGDAFMQGENTKDDEGVLVPCTRCGGNTLQRDKICICCKRKVIEQQSVHLDSQGHIYYGTR